jgi:hypothetical protein
VHLVGSYYTNFFLVILIFVDTRNWVFLWVTGKRATLPWSFVCVLYARHNGLSANCQVWREGTKGFLHSENLIFIQEETFLGNVKFAWVRIRSRCNSIRTLLWLILIWVFLHMRTVRTSTKNRCRIGDKQTDALIACQTLVSDKQQPPACCFNLQISRSHTRPKVTLYVRTLDIGHLFFFNLTFWHRSFTFKFQHTLYVKCE